jgi:FkbM family methyltransferase
MHTHLKYYGAEAVRHCTRAYRRALYRLHCKLHETVTIRTKQGLLTFSTKDVGIGASLWRDGQYEFDCSIRAIRFLKNFGFIPASNVSMLDIGANIGVISIGLLLAREVNLALALEPEPSNFRLLCRNIQQNDLSQQILCLQLAVGETVSALTLELSPDNLGDHRIREVPASQASELERESVRQSIRVESLPLPNILGLPEVQAFGLSSPSFLWIDVQGYETYVFRGGMSLLKKGLPTVSEIWPYGMLRAGISPATFIETVSSIWTDYWIERRGRFTRYPIGVLDRYLEELGTDGYYENVIFTRGQAGRG